MMTENETEGNRIEAVARDSWYTNPAGEAMIRHSYKIFRRYLTPGARVLEMGPAEGLMTKLLVDDGFEPEVLEGAAEFAGNLRKQFPQLRVCHELFEDFEPDSQYDVILMGHVLEHVVDPVSLLLSIRNWLVPGGGLVISSVPNARSLHRQAAVIMGLIPSEHTLSEKDIHHGHRRIYSPESFRNDFIAARYSIEFFGGFWIKPLSDKQLERDWTPAMISAFMVLGERYPDIAAELVVVGKV